MTELEKELRESKIAQIKLLAEQMVSYKFNDYKDFEIEENKPIAYLDATIDILNKHVANAKLTQAKLFKFDKLEAERANLSKKELKQLAEDQERINSTIDPFKLATLDPRASLRGNIHAPNTVILRYRGQGIDEKFSRKYPYGVLL